MESPVVVRKHHRGFCFLEETMCHHFETGKAGASGTRAAITIRGTRLRAMRLPMGERGM